MRLILPLIAFFIFAQVLGIFAGSVLLGDYTSNPYVQSMYIIPQESGESFFNIILIFGMILIGTGALLLVLKYYKGWILFFLLEFFLIAVPSSIIFYSFSRIHFPYLESMIIGVVLGIALALLKFKFEVLKNVAAIFASAAVGAIFGVSFSPLFIILFLVILAVYDYIAVFRTKHMVTLAKEVLKRNMALTISSKVEIPKVGIKRIDLGTGDILAPVMLEVSFLSFNPNASFLVLLGSSIALFLLFYLSRKKKMIVPALPPIVAGILVALLIGMVFGIVTF